MTEFTLDTSGYVALGDWSPGTYRHVCNATTALKAWMRVREVKAVA